MHVHIHGDWPVEALEALKVSLAQGIEIGFGDDIDPSSAVLVWGNPTQEALDALPNLRAVVVPWAGVPPKTLAMVRSRPGVRLFNLHHNAHTTAEMAFALLMAVAKHLVLGDRGLRQGTWSVPDSLGLWGRKALVVGYGAIGRHVGALCRAAGMAVVGVRTRSGTDADGSRIVDPTALPTELPDTHALLVCLPGTSDTEGLIGRSELALLPNDAIVVNVGRGPVIDEDALYEALAEGRLFGAGLDVWYRYRRNSDEPTLPANRPFHELSNVVMSPHHGGNAVGIDEERMMEFARLLKALVEGRPAPNEVDLARGY